MNIKKIKHHSIIIFLLILGIQQTCLAQSKRGNVWAFGYNAGMDFNQIPPVPIRTSAIQVNATSTMSDERGNLLFYTDGVRVWTAQHKVMENGTGLDTHDGNISQQVVIIPKPGSKTQYYIFTISDDFWNHKIRYHEVDFTSNPDGEVSSKNNTLGDQKLLVKISAVLHADKESVWVLVQGSLNNKVYAYLINKNGINTEPVISNADTSTGDLDYGQIKFSPDGKRVAIANGLENKNVNLFHFDNLTGQLSNSIFLNYQEGPNSLEFSPDGKVLYVTSRTGFCSPGFSYLRQYDLSNWSATAIKNSEQIIAQGADNYGVLQLAPDGKIYMGGRSGQCEENRYLDIIHSPKQLGRNCNFQQDGLYLGGNSMWQGLPNFLVSYFMEDPCLLSPNPPAISLSQDTLYLFGSDAEKVSVKTFGNDFTWNDGGKDTSRFFTEAGTYWVTAINECGQTSANLTVINLDFFIPNILTLNHDALNETFHIRGLDKLKGSKELTIYNRYGKALYSNSHYKNDWDGKGLMDGVYFYNLYIPSSGKRYKGWVELVR